jgi:hypothetical protein
MVRVASCELRIANCELRIANCELRIANCELRIANALYVCFLSPANQEAAIHGLVAYAAYHSRGDACPGRRRVICLISSDYEDGRCHLPEVT